MNVAEVCGVTFLSVTLFVLCKRNLSIVIEKSTYVYQSTRRVIREWIIAIPLNSKYLRIKALLKKDQLSL